MRPGSPLRLCDDTTIGLLSERERRNHQMVADHGRDGAEIMVAEAWLRFTRTMLIDAMDAVLTHLCAGSIDTPWGKRSLVALEWHQEEYRKLKSYVDNLCEIQASRKSARAASLIARLLRTTSGSAAMGDISEECERLGVRPWLADFRADLRAAADAWHGYGPLSVLQVQETVALIERHETNHT